MGTFKLLKKRLAIKFNKITSYLKKAEKIAQMIHNLLNK